MKPKKQNIKFLIIISTVIYAFLILFSLHYCAYQAIYPKATITELIGIISKRIQSQPFTFVHAPDGFFGVAFFTNAAFNLH